MEKKENNKLVSLSHLNDTFNSIGNERLSVETKK